MTEKKIPPSSNGKSNSKIDDELKKFEKMADQWWDANGPFRPLHELNPTRIDYIIAQWAGHRRAGNDVANDVANNATDNAASLVGKKILDIGCGGGLLAVAMNKLGASVRGIDADKTTVGVARAYQEKNKLHDGLEFVESSPEELLQDKKNYAAFDMVLAMEVIEHVANPADFVATIKQLVKPDGLIIFSTINRNFRSFAMAIVGAEYILRLLPKGTHQYQRLVRPEELTAYCRDAGLTPRDATGLIYHPFLKTASLSKTNLAVNYFLTATL